LAGPPSPGPPRSAGACWIKAIPGAVIGGSPPEALRDIKGCSDKTNDNEVSIGGQFMGGSYLDSTGATRRDAAGLTGQRLN
jgi:hypothetical protein